MADQQTDTSSAAAAEPEGERPVCTVCRGSGRVLSNLGGTLKTQICPWCEGSGFFIADHDAQAARRGG